MSGNNPENIFKELFSQNRFSNKKIYELIFNIMDLIKELGKKLYEFFKLQITNFCFKEKIEKTSAVSALADCWLEWKLNSAEDEKTINNILKFFKTCIRDRSQIILQLTSIVQLFRILINISDLKDVNAPIIYRTLVFFFLENYDDYYLREIFVNNFINLLEKKKSVPLVILLDPYLRHIKNSSNYEVIDFSFLRFLINHHKMTLEILRDILDFLFYVCLTNKFFSRISKLLINEIIEKFLKPKNQEKIEKVNSEIISNIFLDLEKYIKSSLKIFLKNPKEYIILETPYEILNNKIEKINRNVEEDIIETVQIFRTDHEFYSSGLLALLWNYNAHDDIILNLEENLADKFDNYYYDLDMKRLKEKEIEEKKTMKKSESEIKVINKKERIKPEQVLKLIRDKVVKKEKEKEEVSIKKHRREKSLVLTLNKKVLSKLSEAAREIMENNPSEVNNIRNNLSIQGEIKNFNSSVISNLNSYSIFSPEYDDLTNNKSLIFQKNPLFLMKNFQFFVNLDECESRELVAIEGIFREYGKLNKKMFNFYSNDIDFTPIISRNNIFKIIRDIGIENELISLNELSSIIRLLFGKPLNNFDKLQFDKLIVQISYTIFSKINFNYPLSKCVQKYFIKLDNYVNRNSKENSNNNINSNININNKNNNNNNKSFKGKKSIIDIIRYKRNKTDNKTLNYLRNKLENFLIPENEMKYIFTTNKNDDNNDYNKENDIIYKKLNSFNSRSSSVYMQNENKNQILIPPGFKKKLTTKMEYDFTLRTKPISNLLSESQIICYEILDEIFDKNFQTNIIEPNVKIYNYNQITEENLDPKKKWSYLINITYSNLEKKLENDGIHAGDLMEEMLRGIEKERDTLDKVKVIFAREKEEIEEIKKKEIEEQEKERQRLIRKKEIDDKLMILKEEKEKEKKAKEIEIEANKENKEKELKLIMQKEIEKREKIRKKMQEKKQEKEKEEEESKKQTLMKIEESQKKKEKEREEYFKKYKRKLKEQFTEIRTDKLNDLNQQAEIANRQNEIGKVKIADRKVTKILENSKKYFEFEKNLNDLMENLLQRTDIREYLANYENHLRLIYEIYCKLGSIKITYYNEVAIHSSEFKEFCSNFLIYGLLINTEQMNYIFKNVSKRNINSGRASPEDLYFLSFDDFLLTFIYISIFMLNENNGIRKIFPKDINNYQVKYIKNLLEFIGLKFPYNKRELEKLIEERRNLTSQKMMKLHQKLKLERQDIVLSGSVKGYKRSKSPEIKDKKAK
jgi:hypothetical protein